MDAATLEQYLDYPIQAPPEGVTPNFVNPDSTAYQVYITAGFCLALMAVFSTIRFVSKMYLGPKSIKTDEIVFITGLFLCYLFIGMTIACVSGSAFGRHSWDVLLGAFTKSQLVLSLLVEIFLPLAICFVKVSVLILYRQIFHVLRWMRIASMTGIVVIAAFQVSVSIAFAAMCAPSTGSTQIDFLAAFVSDTCSRTRSLVVIQGAGNVIADVFLVILPLPAVWSLQMPLRRKIGVISMFLVGFCACASSIIGLVYRAQYYSAGEDNLRLAIPLWTTSMAEVSAAVMICCMPTTAALFKSAKTPMRTWWSSLSSRALRLTTFNRSGMTQSGSQSSLKGSLNNGWSAAYPQPHYGQHATWVDTDMGSYSLQEMDQKQMHGNTGVWKKTEVQVV